MFIDVIWSIEKSIIIDYSQNTKVSISIDYRYQSANFIDWYRNLSIIEFIDCTPRVIKGNY